MKASLITGYGAADVLQWLPYATPVPGEEEVLINVIAAGINRADVSQRQGKYPPPPGVTIDIPGMEVAGIVEQCGPGVTQWKPGDKVCALIAGGGYAEKVAVKEGQCLPIPDGWSYAEAASLPETVYTVWSNVFRRAALQKGETLLIHGGSSGIGITAIQLAHLLGNSVAVTVGSDEKGKACLDLGADKYINYKKSDFAEALKEEPIDVILDMIGGDYFEKNLALLREEGRLVYINAIGGNRVQLNIAAIMQKRLTVTGSTLRGRTYSYKKALTADILQHVWPLMQSRKFQPVIYQIFPFEEAAAAHKLMESSEHIGKLILARKDI